MNGDSLGKGMNRNEFGIHRVNKFGDPLTLEVVIAKYALVCSYKVRRAKKFLDLVNEVQISPFGSKGDSHKHDRVDFCHLQVNTTSIGINIGMHNDGHFPPIGANCGIHVFIHNGEEVFENTYGHDVWCIEHCPPKSNNQCNGLQKNTKCECI